MDESWRMSIGTVIPRRRSTEQDRRSRCGGAGGTDALDADYFRDVFGGPPRSVLLRRFSGDARPASSFYEEIFRPAWRRLPLARGGRRLPGFRIPEARASGQVKMDEGFYDDIFGSDGGRERRSRSRSKCSSRSKSSSVLSSAELSPPLRPSIAEDAMLSSFASKLRPITIPSQRHDSSPPSTISGGDQNSHKALNVTCPSNSYFMEFKDNSYSIHESSDVLRHRSHIGFCCFSPPETISLEPSFRQGLRKPGADDIDSPSSVISSVFLDPVSTKTERERENVVVEVDGEEEAAENSFVIEIDNHVIGETEGVAAVNEAITWAKEKFRNQTSNGVDTVDKQLNSEATKEGIKGKERPLAKED